jgi:PilZ domain
MVFRSNKRRDIRTPFSCPVYYSDGDFHASGMTENLTNRGGCLHGTHLVTVGMELMVLLIPTEAHALIIKKATVRWVCSAHFGVELNEADCGAVGELDSVNVTALQGPISIMTH